MTFNDLMKRTDEESHVFTYDVRRALELAASRSELRRLEALIVSAQMAVSEFARDCKLRIVAAKD